MAWSYFCCSAAITPCKKRSCTSWGLCLSRVCTRCAASLILPWSTSCCTSAAGAAAAWASGVAAAITHIKLAAVTGRIHRPGWSMGAARSQESTGGRDIEALSLRNKEGGVDKARAFSPVSAWLTKREILGGIDRLTACRGCRCDGWGTPALRVAGGLLPNAAVPGPWSGPARPRGHRGSGARGCAPGPARTRPARPCRRACRHCPRWGRPRR
ncbi:Uncharacterised protein [Comamonas aquatica]|uniref:Uncharacterized protein n=1 Tax=Comamonas aquatica TaxID=225991 RepID=A0AA35D6T4_9BURK|nr:Uncharacterised protein [Comamonas aquatica]CAC9691040.1 Uncharacterised protein [Comamonas aquatica]